MMDVSSLEVALCFPSIPADVRNAGGGGGGDDMPYLLYTHNEGVGRQSEEVGKVGSDESQVGSGRVESIVDQTGQACNQECGRHCPSQAAVRHAQPEDREHGRDTSGDDRVRDTSPSLFV